MTIIKKIFYIFLPLVLGSIVGLLISNSIDYSNLTKPFLAPPKILFPIFWSIIYLLLGISYYLFKKTDKENRKIDIVYYASLAINLLWSIIFFLLKWRFVSIIWIILLDILVFYLVYLFSKEKKASAYLNIPYTIWLIFATYLTIGIYILN